jgi:hypothetical protein
MHGARAQVGEAGAVHTLLSVENIREAAQMQRTMTSR